MNKLIILSMAILMASCGKETKTESSIVKSEIKLTAEQKQNAGIEFGTLEEKPMAESVFCTGLVDVPPISLAAVSMPIAGYIKSTIEVLPGKQVSKGQVLATVTSMEFIQMQQEYLQAQSQMSLLTNERARQQVLQQEEVGSKKKFQQAEAELGNLQAVSRALSMKLDILGCDMQALSQGKMSSSLTLKSPIDGFIQDQSLAIGKYITPTDVLVKIVGVAHKHVELKVFERDLAKIKIGQKIQFEGDGNQSTGKVFLIGKQVDMNTRLTPVHGHFSIDAEEQKFTVGQFVNARIQVGEQKVLSIPQAGLARVGKGGYIYVEKTDGTMAQIPVEVRSADMEWVGIRPTKEMPAGKVVIRGASALEAIFAKD
ncbi:MAG: efflux RND transporter periplasmic adaptor subunit [Bacteroidota bacterium]